MNIVGIVAEYNPFHAGHRWHIAQTRRRLGECAVVAVMSGNFVQRGDCAIEDKWARTRSALEGGADLVLELPTVWACASAEWFAWGAMSILRAAGAQAISFGSESGDNAALAALSLCLGQRRFQAELRRFLEQGLPFAACRQAAAGRAAGSGRSRLSDPTQRQFGRGVPQGRPAAELDAPDPCHSPGGGGPRRGSPSGVSLRLLPP